MMYVVLVDRNEPQLEKIMTDQVAYFDQLDLERAYHAEQLRREAEERAYVAWLESQSQSVANAELIASPEFAF